MTQVKEEYYPCIYRRITNFLVTLFEWVVKAFIGGIFAYVGATILAAFYPPVTGIMNKILGLVFGTIATYLFYIVVGVFLIVILYSAWKCSAEE
jgi:heme/copper-type cytochrome/quinol oxidase subunit 2